MNGIAGSREGGTPAARESPSVRVAVGLLGAALALQAIQGVLDSPLPTANFPLLVAVLTMVRCSANLHGALYGALAGCAYDGLTHAPVGLSGIAWTIVGFFLPSVAKGLRIHHAGVIACLCAVAFVLQAALYSGLEFILLRDRLTVEFSWQILPAAVLHAGLGMLLWLMLNRVTVRADRVLREARGVGVPGPRLPGGKRGRLRRSAPGVLGHSGRGR
ncbi:MAG: rod shape-determining protein MreD [Bryobacterales bacterium]|nr:rod shape-determining protein MreD [Bryobacterales bacterium]